MRQRGQLCRRKETTVPLFPFIELFLASSKSASARVHRRMRTAALARSAGTASLASSASLARSVVLLLGLFSLLFRNAASLCALCQQAAAFRSGCCVPSGCHLCAAQQERKQHTHTERVAAKNKFGTVEAKVGTQGFSSLSLSLDWPSANRGHVTQARFDSGDRL